MIFRIYPESGQTKIFIESCSGCVIRYSYKKEMSKRYGDKNFHVIGEIGGSARAPNQGDVLIAESGKEIPILTRGSTIRPFE